VVISPATAFAHLSIVVNWIMSAATVALAAVTASLRRKTPSVASTVLVQESPALSAR